MGVAAVAVLARSHRVRPKPSTRGIITSLITRSGRLSFILSMASCPSEATSVMKYLPSSCLRNMHISSSSTMSTRRLFIGMPATALSVGRNPGCMVSSSVAVAVPLSMKSVGL